MSLFGFSCVLRKSFLFFFFHIFALSPFLQENLSFFYQILTHRAQLASYKKINIKTNSVQAVKLAAITITKEREKNEILFRDSFRIILTTKAQQDTFIKTYVLHFLKFVFFFWSRLLSSHKRDKNGTS